MAYLRVYELPDGDVVLDVQSDFIDIAQMRVDVPLIEAGDAPPAIKRLHPIMTVRGEKRLLATQALSAIPSSLLREPCADFSDHRDEVTATLDMLLHGF